MNWNTYKQELSTLKSGEKKDWRDEDNKAVVTMRQYQAVSHISNLGLTKRGRKIRKE